MPEGGTTERERLGAATHPLPVTARRRLWESIWDRLLAPTPEGDQSQEDTQATGGERLQATPPRGSENAIVGESGSSEHALGAGEAFQPTPDLIEAP